MFRGIVDSAAWVDLLPQVALGTKILAEGLARSAADKVDIEHLKPLLTLSAPIRYPFGRALNAVGCVDTILTGRWAELAARLDGA